LLVSCYLLPLTICFAQQDINLTPQEKTQKAKEYYVSGRLLLQQGNYGAANAQFKKAQDLLSQEPALAQGGTAALPLVPSTTAQTSLAQRAFAAAQQGLAQEAIALYLRAIDASPKDADLYYNLGLEYLKTKRFGEATQMFRRVIQLNVKDKDAYFNLAVLYESYLNDKRQALNYYRQYLKYALPSDNVSQIKEWVHQIKKELKSQ
jgi:tetratricopeptide (TPR) repeat protein